jgi:hypothetical protein
MIKFALCFVVNKVHGYGMFPTKMHGQTQLLPQLKPFILGDGHTL